MEIYDKAVMSNSRGVTMQRRELMIYVGVFRPAESVRRLGMEEDDVVVGVVDGNPTDNVSI